MRIVMGADHAGYHLKEKLKEHLQSEGHEVMDAGAHDYDPADDYPVFAAEAASKVSSGEADRGILVCDSGIGVDIVANKFPHVRSALVNNEELARTTRLHNNTNVLSLAAISLDAEKAIRIADNWLETDFSGAERHARRVREIDEIEKQWI